MTIEIWIAFVAASTALLLVPGPTVLLVMSYALSQGRQVALATAAGVALGDFVAMVASLAGLGALVLASATFFVALKWIGAVYLVYLGIQLVRGASTAHMDDIGQAIKKPVSGVFTHAAAVTALNPKSIVFFIAFVPSIYHPGKSLASAVCDFGGQHLSVLAAINALAYALMADKLRRKITKQSVLVWLSRLGGSALIAMGIATAAIRRGTA